MRAPTRDDLPAIAEIVRACDLVDFGDVDIAAEWLQEDWRRPRFDPATDAWVLTAPGGQIVAAAQTWDEEPATIFDSVGWVLPRHRGRGLGTALARAVEARAARDAPGLPSGSAPRVHQVFDAENAGARALFEGLGYAPVREFHHMQIELEPGLGPGSPPPGIEVRPRAERDDPSIFTVMDEGFREHWASSRSRTSAGRSSGGARRPTTPRSGSSPPRGARSSAPPSATSSTDAAGSATSRCGTPGGGAGSARPCCGRRSHASPIAASPP